jgi:hypothetical protein
MKTSFVNRERTNPATKTSFGNRERMPNALRLPKGTDAYKVFIGIVCFVLAIVGFALVCFERDWAILGSLWLCVVPHLLRTATSPSPPWKEYIIPSILLPIAALLSLLYGKTIDSDRWRILSTVLTDALITIVSFYILHGLGGEMKSALRLKYLLFALLTEMKSALRLKYLLFALLTVVGLSLRCVVDNSGVFALGSVLLCSVPYLYMYFNSTFDKWALLSALANMSVFGASLLYYKLSGYPKKIFASLVTDVVITMFLLFFVAGIVQKGASSPNDVKVTTHVHI